MPVNSELVARLLQPIPGDAPAGADLRYDLRIDAIKEARREDLDLPSNNAEVKRKLADWPQVVSLTTELLANETKDLQLAAWLTEGLMHRDGYGGFATGLTVVRGYLDEFWESVHPQPDEDDDDELRAGPIEWMGAKLPLPLRMIAFGPAAVSFLQIDTARSIPTEAESEQSPDKREARQAAIEQGKTPPEAVESALAGINKAGVRAIIADLDQLREAINALDKTTDARFASAAPSLLSVRNTVDEIKRYASTLLAKRLEQDPDPEVSAASDETVLDTGADGEPISIEPSNRVDALNRLGVIARYLRAQDATNPAPYLLLRGLRWGELLAAAPSLDPKLLEAPPTATRSRLKALLIDGRWSELLEQCEALMALAAGRGWLDLQRYVLTACAGLGGNYDATALAIRSELRALLAALPGLSRMTLMDDTPTANEETRAWLASEGLEPTTAAADADGAAAAADATDDTPSTDGTETLANALEDDASGAQQGGFSRARTVRRTTVRGRDAFDTACGELAQNRPSKAIEILMAELARDQSARGRMVRQTQIAYIMVEAGFDAVAEPILQRIIETIDERNLEQWESGPLVAQPLALMCRVLDRTGGDESTRNELYLRVCRLDPLQALALRAK